MSTLPPNNTPEGIRERLRRVGWALDRQVVAPYAYTAGRIVRSASVGPHARGDVVGHVAGDADEHGDGSGATHGACRIEERADARTAGRHDEERSERPPARATDPRARRRMERRSKPREVGLLLRLTRDLPLSAVEFSDGAGAPHAALLRATEHALRLGLPFAHACGGDTILERNVLTGMPRELDRMPSPGDLWQRVKDQTGITPAVEQVLLKPSYHDVHRPLWHHQIRATHLAVEAIARGDRDVRLVLAAGTGRTLVAFQICHRLWAAHWNRAGEARRPRILYLCDGEDLLDAARTGVFAPFRHARHALADGVVENREIYFATPETLLGTGSNPSVMRALPRDFFDLIVEDRVATCDDAGEAGCAAILRHFDAAARVRLRATPDAARSALFTYSLRQGVEDGRIAPCRWVDVDRESKKRLTGRKGTHASAAALVAYLESTDPWAKTLVFCHDDEHAARMTASLVELCAARSAERRDYVGCFTPDAAGRARFDRFRDVDRKTPVLGVATPATPLRGVPTLANVALCAEVETEAALLALVGQGVYLRTDHGKWRYDVLDLTGRARDVLARSSFAAEPDRVTSWSASGASRTPGGGAA